MTCSPSPLAPVSSPGATLGRNPSTATNQALGSSLAVAAAGTDLGGASPKPKAEGIGCSRQSARLGRLRQHRWSSTARGGRGGTPGYAAAAASPFVVSRAEELPHVLSTSGGGRLWIWALAQIRRGFV